MPRGKYERKKFNQGYNRPKSENDILITVEDGHEYLNWYNNKGELQREPGDWADVLKTDERSSHGYSLLCYAIVMDAVKKKDLSFFHSDWFKMIMPKLDGPTIAKQVEQNFEDFNCGFAMVEVDDPKHPGKKKLIRYQGPEVVNKLDLPMDDM